MDAHGQRKAQQLHALGVIMFAIFCVRGAVLMLTELHLILLPQQMVLGYLAGFVSSRVVPQLLLGAPALSCRYCIFSWEVIQRGHCCVLAEWECLKEHAIFLITAGKRNCLTRKLYDGPRTVPYIATTVTARLRELSSGQGAQCCF